MATARLTHERKLAALHALGFDRSEAFGKRWGLWSIAVRCSACDASVINGVACHESGCPNAVHECQGCDALVSKGVRYCADCR